MKFLATTVLILACLTAKSQSTFRLQMGYASTDRLFSILQIPNGDIVVAGTSVDNGLGNESELWVTRLSPDGTIQWSRFYGGSSDEFGGYLAPGEDGNFWLCGATWSFGKGYDDLWVLKLDSTGEVIFDTTYGGPNSDTPSGICATIDGGVAIVGTTIPDSIVSNSEITLTKLDSDGHLVFQREFGGPIFDYGRAVIQSRDGNFFLAGTYDASSSNQNDPALRFFLIATDEQGDSIWTRHLAHPNLPDVVGGQPRTIVQLGDGSLLAAGDMTVRFWPDGKIEWIDGNLRTNTATAAGPSGFLLAHEVALRRLDQNRNVIWSVPMDEFFPDMILLSPDSGIVLAGYTSATSNSYLDGLVLKTNCEGELIDDACTKDPISPQPKLEIRIGPNPVQGSLRIELMGMQESEFGQLNFYDTRGRLVTTIDHIQNEVYEYSTTQLASGIYMIRVMIEEKILLQQKLIVYQ